MNCSKNLSKSDTISLFIIGCLYYFQIRLYVNPVEDVMYAYIRTLQGGDFSRPISSIFDLFTVLRLPDHEWKIYQSCVHTVSMRHAVGKRVVFPI